MIQNPEVMRKNNDALSYITNKQKPSECQNNSNISGNNNDTPRAQSKR